MRRRYEIATTDNFRNVFEIGLVCTTANYTLNADGTVLVDNSGAKNTPTGPRNVAIGQAKQISGGKLEVTFTPPAWGIYAPYNIVALIGAPYEVAIVYSCTETLGLSSPTFWILSRTPQLPANLPYDSLVSKIQAWGFDPVKMGLTQTQQPSNCVY